MLTENRLGTAQHPARRREAGRITTAAPYKCSSSRTGYASIRAEGFYVTIADHDMRVGTALTK